MTQPIMPLPYPAIDNFLSNTQLEQHYILYKNYYNQVQEVPAKLNNLGQTNSAAMRGGQKTLQYALAGRDLHELYFENMSTQTTSLEDISEELQNLITKSFGSVETWLSDFVACAMAARGWALVEYDPKNDILYNVVADFHDEGVTAGFPIILALDMYEHAYFFDYQTNKKQYIENFMTHVNWEAVNQRIAK